MVARQIDDVKQFMKYILASEIFDEFCLYQLDISSFCDFSINGTIHSDFFTIEEQEDVGNRKNVLWGEVRAFVFQVMKGKKTPLSFRIVLMLPENQFDQIAEKCGGRVNDDDISGLYMNILYENKSLNIVTGTSRKSFTLDKILDEVWDHEVNLFLKKFEIS